MALAAAMTRKTASNKRAATVHSLQMSTICSRAAPMFLAEQREQAPLVAERQDGVSEERGWSPSFRAPHHDVGGTRP